MSSPTLKIEIMQGPELEALLPDIERWTRIRTPNSSFNRAWQTMSEYHGPSRMANGWVFDISKPPRLKNRGKKRDAEWKAYAGALMNMVLIGTRNGWLHIHVDGQGSPVYLYFYTFQTVRSRNMPLNKPRIAENNN